jgi:hypothetical protein
MVLFLIYRLLKLQLTMQVRNHEYGRKLTVKIDENECSTYVLTLPVSTLNYLLIKHHSFFTIPFYLSQLVLLWVLIKSKEIHLLPSLCELAMPVFWSLFCRRTIFSCPVRSLYWVHLLFLGLLNCFVLSLVRVWERGRERECVCVCERERERERKRERERNWVCETEREIDR